MRANRRERAEGVSIQPRSSIHPVARASRCPLFGTLSVVSLFAVEALWALPAGAAESVPAAEVLEAPAPVEAQTYRASLALAYLAAPFLAVGIGAGTFEATDNDGVAAAAGALMFLTPAAMHVYHGAPEQAAESFGSMLGLTLLGMLVGGATGYIVGDMGCDDEVESDCDVAAFAPTIYGVVLGGFAGYIGNAIYDVSSNAVVPSAAPAKPSVNVWFAPTRAGVEGQATGVGSVSGLKVGASVSF
jgi:hypothetical protein